MSTINSSTPPVVLIVNDTADAPDTLAAMLRREGYGVVTAVDALRAIELARSSEPDVIISNDVMPLMDGLEFCRKLKQDAHTARVPVLLVGDATTNDEGSLQSLMAAADDYLKKPFSHQEFLVKVARLTERRRVERRYREIVETERVRAEASSQESERRLLTLLSNLPGMAYRCRNDADWTMEFVSDGCFDLTGHASPDLIENRAISYASLIHQDDRERVWQEVQAALLEHQPFQLTYRIVTATGTEKWVWEQGRSVSYGEATKLEGFIIDITERKQAERALRASEEHYRVLFESNPHPMWVYDLETLAFLSVNEAAIRHYGYTNEEFLRLTIKEIRPPEAVPGLIEGIQKIVTEFNYSGNHFHRKKDGSIINVEITSHKILFAGRHARLVMANDITERVEAERRLRASVQQMETLTALATAVNDRSEMSRLLGGLADSISKLTDYRTSVLALFADEPSHGLRVVSYSSNIPAEFIERLSAGSYPRDEISRLIEEGARIEVGELGFAAYYPPDYHHLLDRVFPERYKTRMDKPRSADGSRWHEGDELFVPLVTHEGDYIGFISLDDPRSGRAPDYGSVLPVVALARQVTQLLAQQQAAQSLTQQAEREAVINRISRAVRRSLDTGEVFRTAVTELGRHLNVDRCSLFMLDKTETAVRQVAEYLAPGMRPINQGYKAATVRELIEGVRRHGVLTFDDASTDERIKDVFNSVLRQNGVRSVMYVAINVGDEVPAAFALTTIRQTRQWRESDIALARAVADQTGIAIRQAELYQKAAATSAREALNNRLSFAIRASLSLPEVLQTATHELGRALQASRVYLRLYDAAHPHAESLAEHEYVAANSSSVRQTAVTYDDPVGQHLLHSLRSIIVDDTLNYMDDSPELGAHVRAHDPLLGARSMINCPVIVNGQFRGALCIHQTERIRQWTEDEVALVESVAAQLATGIAQAELFEVARRAKKEWETTFDAMSDGIYIFDLSGRLTRVNRAGAALEDSWPHLLLGRHCCNILRGSSQDQSCIVERAFEEDRSITVEITPERSNRPLLVTVEPIIGDEHKTVGVVCTARDLSELRRVEAVARERQTLLTNILESARESIFAIDTQGYFQWCNSAFAAASGYQTGEIVGRYFLDAVAFSDARIVKQNFERTLQGEPQNYEIGYTARDGNFYYLLIDNAPLVVDGRITGVLGIARDITEQKQERERAAQADKLRALGQLASGVAHDFNNALAAILGRVQLVRRQSHDQTLTHNLNIIQTAAEDAAATVRRIQTFARQSQTEEFEVLAVDNLLRDAIEITRTRWENEARARGLLYNVTLDAATGVYASGNASELREVFINLIFNAVDAMAQGGDLSISCVREDARLHLRFADTGTGMTQAVRDRIFEPFYTTKGVLGTGLGLAVSYGIIERHDGHISVESAPGHGTTFEIVLPAVEFVVATADTGEPRRIETVPLSVLVVDDEEFVRDTLGDMLGVLSHKVTKAHSGHEALQQLETQAFDIVFTDLSMPEMDGWEVARETRRRRPQTLIVLVTGYGKGTTPPSGETNLIDGAIGKPFDFKQVEEIIAKVTENIINVKR
ncbi:MAG: PAS domain S-box protein [Pyrinomonadaceae bacterium]